MLKISYWDDLKGEPAILMAGGESDLLRFSDFLSAWSRSPSRVTLNGQAFVDTEIQIDIELSENKDRSGMRIRNIHQVRCMWILQVELAHNFSSLVRGVAESKIPSHTYLDSESDDVSVVVSKGEYV